MAQLGNDHREGPIAKTIESQTSKLPSDLFLWAALGSMAIAATLKATNQRHTSLFVGQWAPSFHRYSCRDMYSRWILCQTSSRRWRTLYQRLG